MKFLEFKKTGAAVHDVVIGGSWTYSLHFGKMTQINKKYGMKSCKKIRRNGPTEDLSWTKGTAIAATGTQPSVSAAHPVAPAHPVSLPGATLS